MFQRLAWPDAAKGLSILLVVVLHGTMWIEYLGASSAALTTFNTMFASMRMPLFFCIAGIFGSKWIEADWRTLATSKLSLLIWIFIAWQPVFFAFKYFASLIIPEQHPSLLGQLARMIVSPIRPNGETWFLWALVIYFVLAKAFRRVQPFIHLSIAGFISLLFSGIVRPWLGADTVRLMGTGLEMVVPLYFFFAFGLILKHKILELATSLQWQYRVLVLLAWATLAGIAASSGSSRAPGVEFMLQLLGVGAGIALGTLLKPVIWLQRIGQNTLPIYVGHMLFISTAVSLAYAMGIRTDGEASSASLSLVISAISICASLVLWKRSQGNAIGHMYTMPPKFHRLLQDPTRYRGDHSP